MSDVKDGVRFDPFNVLSCQEFAHLLRLSNLLQTVGAGSLTPHPDEGIPGSEECFGAFQKPIVQDGAGC